MYVCVSVLHSRWLKLYGHIHQAASCIKSVKTRNYKARKAWEDMVWICVKDAVSMGPSFLFAVLLYSRIDIRGLLLGIVSIAARI